MSVEQMVGRRVRVHYSSECEYCQIRDPERVLDGKIGRVVSLMPITFTAHYFEVAFEDNTVLHAVPVPGIELVREFTGNERLPAEVELATPNFANAELECLE